MTDAETKYESEFVHYPFGALLLAYKPDGYDDDSDEHYGSEFLREAFPDQDSVERRIAQLIVDGFETDDMELIVLVDEGGLNARLTRNTQKWQAILRNARTHVPRLRYEAEAGAMLLREEERKRAAQETENWERANYERLKAKFEGKS